MRVRVKVKTNSRIESVAVLSDGTLKISVRAVPEKGLANQAMINVLSKFHKIPKSRIKIVAGHKNPNKVVEINV